MTISDKKRENSQEFKKLFQKKIRERCLLYLRSLSLLASLLFPSFGILDHILFPAIALKLNIIRLSLLPVLWIVFALTYNRLISYYVNVLGSVVFQFAAGAITLMVFYTGGVESNYYAGINLVQMAMFAVMPWHPLISFANGLGMYLTYLAAIFFHNSVSLNSLSFISNSYFILGTLFIGTFWSIIGFKILKKETLAQEALSEERERSENLLQNILPSPIARELKKMDQVQSKYFDRVSVLFTDFVGFTSVSSDMTAETLVKELDYCFQVFDIITKKYGIEKLKTIGDSYMCACGIPETNKMHAINCVLAGMEILDFSLGYYNDRVERGEKGWQIRIGVHSGPVVAGVVGIRKFAYDIWGDTVNIASRMESNAEINSINISHDTYVLLNEYFDCVSRGEISVKGKGHMLMYRVDSLKEKFRENGSPRIPNDEFFRQYRSQIVYG